MAIDRNKVIAAAQKYIQKGAYRKAIREYSKIIDEHPDDVRILLKIGDLRARDGQAEAAAATYNDVADHYVAHGFFLKAVAAYKLLLGVQPDNLEAKLRLADLHFQLGLLRDAMANYLEVAAIYNGQGNTQRYLELLERVVEIDPKHAGNRIQLAEELARFDLTDAAAEHFRFAAQQLREQGRFDEYTKVMERYVHTQPYDTAAIHELANTYLQLERPKRALVRLQPAFQADPTNHRTLELMVNAMTAHGEGDRAIALLEELAATLDAEHNESARDEVYTLLLRYAPDHAAANAAVGEPAQPMATFEVADAPAPLLDPAAVEKLLEETDVYLKYNLFDKALEHLNQVFSIDPENLGGLERKKTVLMATGREESAIGILIGMARIAERTDHVQAMLYLNQALAIQPDHPGVLATMAELDGGAPRVFEPSMELLDVNPVSVTGNTPSVAEPAEFEALEPAATGEQEPAPAQDLDVPANHIEHLFEGFDMEDTAGGHRVLTNDVVASLMDEEEDDDVLTLGTDEILPEALDMGLEDVDIAVAEGDHESARQQLFELFEDWPQHAELLLRRMESLPALTGDVESDTVSRDDGYAAPSSSVSDEREMNGLFVAPDDEVYQTYSGEFETIEEDAKPAEFAPDDAVEFAPADAVEFAPDEVAEFAPDDAVDFAPTDAVEFTAEEAVEFTPVDDAPSATFEAEDTAASAEFEAVEFTPVDDAASSAFDASDADPQSVGYDAGAALSADANASTERDVSLSGDDDLVFVVDAPPAAEPAAVEAPADDPFAALEALVQPESNPRPISGASQRPARRTVPPLPAIGSKQPTFVGLPRDEESASRLAAAAAALADSSAPNRAVREGTISIDEDDDRIEVVDTFEADSDVDDEIEITDDFDDLDASDAIEITDDLHDVSAADAIAITEPDASSPGARALTAAQAAAAVAADVDAPVGRASSLVSATFGPSDVVVRDQDGMPFAEAILQRRDGMGMMAMMTLQEYIGSAQDTPASFELAVANIEMGLFFEGIGSLEQLLGLPDLAQDDRLLVHYFLGIAYEAMDQVDLAHANFEVVAESTPEMYPDVFIRLNRLGELA